MELKQGFVLQKVFITGTAGFIGFHLANLLLGEGFIVHGYDGMTSYYNVELKQSRHKLLFDHASFSATEGMLEDLPKLKRAVEEFKPDLFVHLAAQAGVRYSLEHPRDYVESNIVGTFNVMEMAKQYQVKHLLLASTSSVYGANDDLPFSESDKADTQLTIYAATKKAGESMSHAYSHLWGIPTTIFRFFTVYGPMGRPDLALYKFVEAMICGKAIDVYNHGDMYRDFTYVEDLVKAIRLLMEAVPPKPDQVTQLVQGDSLSPVAPFRIVNIGNSEKIKLGDFINFIEEYLGVTAERNYLPMQMGDVPATWANTSLLKNLTGYRPETSYQVGIAKFIDWYKEYRQ